MAALRSLVAAVTLFVASMLIYALCIVPYEQNVMKKRLEKEFDRLDAAAGSANFAIAPKIRDNIDQLRRALKFSPTDPDLFMELAAEYRLIGANDEAIATLRKMLQYHRRPEIYLNMADLQFDRRDFAGATESYAYAVAFAPEEINLVPNVLIPAVNERAKELTVQIAR
jgi:tetratricopeptide (TPR) repeat protein